MLAHTSPQHRCRYVSIAALFLCLMQHVKNHAFLSSQAVADIGYPVTMIWHWRMVPQPRN